MKRIVTALLILVSTVPATAQWYTVNTGVTGPFEGVFLTDSANIFIIGETGVSVASHDGGATWTPNFTGYMDDMHGIHFPTCDTGYVTADDEQVLKSTDGGYTWTLQPTPATDGLYGIFFVDGFYGYSVGKDGNIVHTSTGGNPWLLQTSGTTERLEEVFFTSYSNGHVVGRNDTYLRTTNGGTNWTVYNNLTGTGEDLKDVHFTDGSTGYIVGGAGIIYITTNAGLTWTALNSGVAVDLNAVHFVSANIGYVAGDAGTILKTTNAGASWTLETTPTTNNLNDIHFGDPNNGYAVGDLGTVIAIHTPNLPPPSPSASFHYNGPYCQDDPDPSPVFTSGSSSSNFSATPAGLVINSTTGVIDLSASAPGTYTVTDGVGGNWSLCTPGSQASTQVTVQPTDDPSFSYPSSQFCLGGANPTPTVITSGGTFTVAPSGLVMNASTGQINLSTSAAGTYNITYTTNGACPDDSTISITITAPPDPTFTFGGPYCPDASDPLPQLAGGAVSGTFSATPAGLVINPTTGQVDLSASTPGTYTVTNTVPASGGCAATSHQTQLTINPFDDPSFNYGGTTTFCLGGTNLIPTITTPGGTFTVSPSGLVINALTGEIDLTNSAAGNYSITYTTSGNCPDDSTISVNVTTSPDPGFTYGGPYCPDDPDPQAQLVPGAQAGSFTASPAGLVINASTGLIDVSASNPGTYTVTNTIAASGGCPAASHQATVVINALDDPSFNYGGSTSFCLGSANPIPTITTTGGAFTAAPAGIVINPSNGEIDLTNSTAGTYDITYTTAGPCPDDSTIAVTITAPGDPTFSYAGPYCPGDPDPSPQLGAGATAGTFTVTPAGLVINPSTGVIDLSASTPGTYTVTNTISATGPCPAISHQATVILNPLDDPGFNYGGGTFCLTGSNPTPTVQTSGGTFTATPAGLSINAITGVINLAASSAGGYSITYTTNGPCPDDSTTTVNLTQSPDATFSFGGPYCPNDPDPQPQYPSGASAGTFTASPAGLVLNATTGLVDLSASTPGTYTVTNSIAASGGCPAVSHQATITIDPVDDPGFDYGATAFCLTGSNPTPTVQTSGGTFTATPSGLTLNGATGQIDLTTSAAGTYSITYTTNGPCPDDSTQTITLTAPDDPTFSYGGPYCITDPDPAPQMGVGAVMGIFSATPAGLTINSSTGVIDLSASTAGTYTITNTLAASGPCPAVAHQTSVTINAQDDPTFSYPSNTLCVGGSNVLPSITTPGGTFSVSPSGMSLNAATGEINLGTSSAGTYTVTYTTNGPCPDNASATITITTAPDATFSYSGPYCPVDPDPQPQFGAGASAGSFSVSPTGLMLNASTGLIDLSASTPGTYNITNSIVASGGCPAVSHQAMVTILAEDDAGFSYTSGSYCLGSSNPLPTVNTPGGTFTVTPSGLTLNGSTGEMDLSSSTAGSYNITYQTTGACPNDSTVTITLTAPLDPTFSYAGPYCLTDTDPLPQLGSGATGGVFSATPSGLMVNSSTGEIDLSASNPGIYTVTNTLAASGPCPAVSHQTTLVINPTDDPSFAYPADSFCLGGTNPTPTIITSGGTFTVAPTGMIINGITGEVDLGGSQAGTYQITYTTNGPCPDDSTVSITLTEAQDPGFTFGGPYCPSDPDPQPQMATGAQAGTFSATPAGLTIDPKSGLINLSASSAGSYTVTNTIASSGPCPSVLHSATVTVLAEDDATFSYGGGTFCTGGSNPTPTMNTQGGTFTSTPSGLVINAGTGVVDLAASLAGNYTITYITSGVCPDTVSLPITITSSPDATFSFGGPYCPSDPDPQPQFAPGASGGTFTASPAGLVINATTGLIDLSTSVPGTYTVTNSIAASGSCPAVSSQSPVTVLALDDPGFTYGGSTFCTGAGTVTPTVVMGGGTFSVTPAGAPVDPTTGTLDLSNSAPGAYTITYTTNGSCAADSSLVITIAAAPSATFQYGGPYCATDPDPQPQLMAGSSTGQFSATPAGLIINSATGVIDLDASQPGSYTVTNTIAASGGCPAVSGQAPVTIQPVDDASFNYGGSTFCTGGQNPMPTVVTPGGSFTGQPAGLVIDASTGVIDLNSSTPGTYGIVYQTSSVCPASDTLTITITTSPDATFTYGGPYCQSDPDPQPQFGSGASGGTFTAIPAGLVISSSNGVIDLSASTPGTYTITNAIAASGSCPATTHQTTVTIDAQDDPTISYPANTFCTGGNNPTPAVQTPGGTFTASPAGLILNAATGIINLTSSSTGTYSITYTTNGGCPASSTVSITITSSPDATFSYGGPYCQTDTDPQPQFAAGASAGVFSATPAGLVIDPSTGIIDLDASTPGTYTVSNSIAASGSCPAVSHNSLVTIHPLDDAGFSYPATSFCLSGTDPTPTVNTPGGTFTVSPSGLAIDPSTGTINLATSSAGAYTITYTTNQNCPASSITTITLEAASAVALVADTSLCLSDDPITLSAIPGGGTFSGTGVSGNVFDPSVAGVGVWTITYNYVSPSGCTATTSVDIAVTDHTVDAGPDQTIAQGQQAQLNASGGIAWAWSPQSTLSCSGCSDPIAFPNETTTYTVTSTSAAGCVAMDDVTIFVQGRVVVPNAFSPNGDGHNDAFLVPYLEASQMRLEIYDRWGSLLFKTTDPNEGWDGIYRGTPQEIGVYIYVLHAEMIGGGVVQKKGNVTLLR